MKLRVPAILSFVLILIFSAKIIGSEHSLMPVPKEIKWLEGKFRLTNEFSVSIKGSPNERIYSAATRMLRRLDARTGLFFNQDFITPANNLDSSEFIIYVLSEGRVVLGEDESYKLLIEENSINVHAPTDLGAMHAMETFLQLLQADEEGYYLPMVEINDEPRFQWRGLMMDVARHFMPVDVIKRNLDAMAAMKMNVFHWHLSEDQGFRIESKIFPQLHELCSDGQYFTQAQVKDILKYAEDRGIRVYPEFDIPGHATSWFVAFPELASATGPYKIERQWGIFDPTFDPTKEETYEFFDKFFGEMTELFPDEYFHIGGDENNGKQWDANEGIQEFMKAKGIEDNHQLQAYFNQRILKILTKYNKKMVGWDEILHDDMPTNIVIQSWRGKEAMIESAKKGYMTMLSNGYYIDLIQPASFHYLNDPLEDDTILTPEEQKRILGGEATSWAELVTYETVDSRIWPRTAAIAERFWSPKNVNNIDDMYRRLDRISFLLEEHGLLHIKNYEMMLRRLTDNNDIIYLKTLVDIVEPVKIYQRHFQGVKYYQHSPYTRIVDAARPESKTAMLFNKLIDEFLIDRSAQYRDKIISYLNLWENNHDKLTETTRLSPIISEIIPMSENLKELSRIGLEAIMLIRNNEKAPVKWKDKATGIIEAAKKPYGQVELRVTAGIEKLLRHVF